MKSFLRTVIAVLAIVAVPMVAHAASPAPSEWPANLRWDLVPRWIQWANGKANISWPPNDGCAERPHNETIPVGAELDRFGSEGGTFFSPKGESFRGRAVPYVCKQMDYRVYRVLKPIPVKACKAAPWFDEPGGAKQVQTAEPAFKLLAAGAIQAVEYDVGGSDRPSPLCGDR